jgi:hypothetical protein
MRHRLQADCLTILRRLFQQFNDFAIVKPHELFENQHREELMLSELLRVAEVRVGI